MKINILSDETINQIAAGEVIERPLSVVKELLENAIDAGSTAVSVEIHDGGISMIRVTDNGGGIAEEDVRNAFVRHATSKIRDARDLLSIQTLGFRGEALASIASVARVELITKTPGALMAVHYQIEGGVEKDFAQIGAPDGTTFIVRDLFKNVPARRKFLKSPQAEAARIQDILEKEALAHPEVAFRYLQDGRQLLATLGNGSLLDVVYSIYGRDVTNQLITVNRAYQRSALTGLPAVTVRGFIGKPVITRANRNFELYFVNERFVKNPMIMKAIEDGYRAFLMQHKFPFVVLMIDVNPEIVDVNVHPQKLEVRFSDGMLIYNSVLDAVQNALRQTELIVNTDLDNAADGRGAHAATSTGSGSAVPKPPVMPHVEPFEKKRVEATREVFAEALRPQLHPDAAPKEDIYLQGQPRNGSSGSSDGLHERRSEAEMPCAVTTPSDTMTAAREQKATVAERLSTDDVSVTKDIQAAAGTSAVSVAHDVKDATDASAISASSEEKSTSADVALSALSETTAEAPAPSTSPETAAPAPASQKPEQETLFSERFLSEQARTAHRIIGQVFETYWLVEYGDKLYIIDQHAAHEKVNFERMMKRLREKKPASQYLNPPILLTLTADETRVLEEHMSYFEQLGYVISSLGDRDYSISAIPTDLPELSKKELLLEILDELTDEAGMTTPDTIYDKIASMSCKAAVKGNNKLSLMEADALIGELLTLENPYACPHGRPTIISMSKTELEKKFKRIV
ncbi:DNA mismatch repair endonuclease MutL [Oribacterium sp. Sow4_G1_1]|uniref:DNA mismatch repair endonuclease MutL n=1 Tax=Oribacterium sp. Sow4_G1_1 TaxID=3438794 RepID=UPI003F957540